MTVDALSTLDLNGGDSISGGTLGNSGLLDATGTNGLHGIALTNASGATLESTGGVLTINSASTLVNIRDAGSQWRRAGHLQRPHHQHPYASGDRQLDAEADLADGDQHQRHGVG